jgi:hypothetical protein
MLIWAFLILALILAHRWPFTLAEKGNFKGKTSRGAIYRALCWRTLWRLFLTCALLSAVPAFGADYPEEAGRLVGQMLIITRARVLGKSILQITKSIGRASSR